MLLEAMRAGLPLVATDTGGIPEIVEMDKVGFWFRPPTHLPLARALNRVLSDRKLAENLGNNGRRRSKRYRWTHLAGEVLSVYGSL